MKTKQLLIMNLAALMAVVMVTTVWAQEKRTEVPAFLTTPDRVESRIGSLEFNDGYPTGETAAKIRDELDYLHGVEAFMNSIQGVSTYAIRKGLMDAGVNDNDFIIYTGLMDSKSLFLTANADTVYYMSVIDS